MPSEAPLLKSPAVFPSGVGKVIEAATAAATKRQQVLVLRRFGGTDGFDIFILRVGMLFH